MNDYIFFVLMISQSLFSLNALQALGPEEMIQRIMQNSALLKAAEVEGWMNQESTLESSLRPNPELSFGGELDSRCRDNSNFTVGVSQLFETAGKRQARIQYSQALEDIQDWTQVVVKNQLIAEAHHKLIDTFFLQESLNLATKAKDLSSQLDTCQARLYSCGKITHIAKRKAEMQCSLKEIARLKALQLWETAKKSLALLWGSTEVDFESVEYPLETLPPLPCWDLLLQLLKKNPEILRKEAEIYSTFELSRLERKRAVPNFVLSGAYSDYFEGNDQCFGVGISFPIPLFNRNQHAITRANLSRTVLEYQLQDLRNQLEVKLRAFFDQAGASWKEAIALRDTVIIPLEECMREVEEGFQKGKFSQEDWMDAQKDYLETKHQYLEVLKTYHHHYIDVLNLIGQLECS